MTSILDGYTNWPGAKRFAKITRYRTIRGKCSREVEYLITSLPQERAGPEDSGTPGVTLPATLDWGDASDADSYLVEVADNASFDAPLLAQQTVSVSTCNVSGLAYNTQYWWRVSAGNADGSRDADNNPFDFRTETDSYPPHVVSTSPSPGSSDASVSGSVRIVFDEAMAQGVTEAAVSMEDALGDPVTIDPPSLSVDGMILTFTSSEELEYESEHTVVVAGSATDETDNPLDSGDYTFSFTTQMDLVGLATGEGCVPRGEAPLARALFALAVVWIVVARRRVGVVREQARLTPWRLARRRRARG